MTVLLIGYVASPKYSLSHGDPSEDRNSLDNLVDADLQVSLARRNLAKANSRNPASISWLIPWQMARFVDNRRGPWIRISATIDRFQFESSLRKDPVFSGAYQQMECVLYIAYKYGKTCLPERQLARGLRMCACVHTRKYSKMSDWGMSEEAALISRSRCCTKIAVLYDTL